MTVGFVAATAFLIATGQVAGIGDQAPVRTPACEVYKISGPTVIAFFNYEGCPSRPYCEDALDDFQFHLQGIRKPFDESTIRIHECYRLPFEVEVRGEKRRVSFEKGVGYYLISPDKAPRVELGVVTDADLIQLMKDYFGPDVVNKALVQPESPLPVEWGSLLTEFAAHDAPAKAYVVSKAADSTDSRSRALATALLSDWDLSLHSERLKHPMPVHAPKLQSDDRQAHAEVFEFIVDVGEDGRVLSARFYRQPKQTEIGNEVLRIVQASLFRPAFRGGRFVRAELTMESLLHVK